MKTRTKTLLSVGTLFVFIILFIASATEKKIAIQRIPAQFDYAPPTEGFERSKDISFILIAPRYAEGFRLMGSKEPYASFVKAMSVDFVEMITTRGYPYKGPYGTYDELVYSDKKTTDLILEIEIDLKFTEDNFMKTTMSSTKGLLYYAEGDFIIDGKLNLIASEPFTKTRVWVKSIPIEPVRSFVKSEYGYPTQNEVYDDAAVWNAVIKALDMPYKNSMKLAWNHLEPLELEVKKQEAEEIKKNSGFIKN